MFFISQNLNHVYMTFYFLEFFIFFWITQVGINGLEFISHHITEILYLNTNSKGKQSWNKKSIFSCFFHEIKTNIFTCFFNIKLKIPYEPSLSFLSFMNTISEAAVRRCSSKWVLLKISQYSKLKWDSNRGAFLWIC